MTLAYISCVIISNPPVKPCKRRRHSNPQMRVNRFVFLNFRYFSLGGPSQRNGFALPAGYVTLPVDDRSLPLGLMPIAAGSKAFDRSFFAFSQMPPRLGKAHHR